MEESLRKCFIALLKIRIAEDRCIQAGSKLSIRGLGTQRRHTDFLAASNGLNIAREEYRVLRVKEGLGPQLLLFVE